MLPCGSARNISVFSLFVIIFILTEAEGGYIDSYCNNNMTYSGNSKVSGNLKALLDSLRSNSSQQNGEYSTVMGFGTTDAVNGLFLCRGDINTTLCQHCVTTSSSQITILCPNQTEAIIWYDECFLRYTNKYFKYYSIQPRVNYQHPNNNNNNNNKVSHVHFNHSLFVLLDGLATDAANSMMAKKFSTGQVEVTKSITVYGLAQCTITDMTNSHCQICLRNAIGTLPVAQQGGAAMLASCVVRYELFPFYNTTGTGTGTPSSGGKKIQPVLVVIIVVLPIVLVILLCSACYYLQRRLMKKRRTILIENFGDEVTAMESLQFSLATIEAATNKFSVENKIGRGGFGAVYKGILSDGRQIAVKKLSTTSGQGSAEFKNEVLLIAKLQHRNLVTLTGFCLEEQEKILIYEYVPNKSLDYFLFEPQKQRVLQWFERYKIIRGIARGIQYLHEHSRLKVIHRDLKPSNVLLDDNMNPKISDFGMARIVGIDQERQNTKRIVGTYGYMSPEYAMHGQFSEKLDVFSFGVIVLEIVSAKRNARRIESQDCDDLLSMAWRQWRNQTPLEIMDSNLRDSFSQSEVIKCLQIGLLCVNTNPEDRPTMSKVVSYLGSLLVELPVPEESGFSMKQNIATGESSSGQSTNNSTAFSINDMTNSISFPR